MRRRLPLSCIALAAASAAVGSAAVCGGAGALAATTPAPVARLETAVPGSAAPWLAAGRDWYAAVSRSGSVLIFTPDSATPAARVDLEAEVAAPVVALGDRLALPLRGGDVILLRAPRGEILTRLKTGPGEALLSVASEGFLIADPAGGLALVDPNSGTERWRASLVSTPSVAATQCGDQALAGTAQGGIVAVSMLDGQVRWSEPLAGGPISTPVTCAGKRAWAGSVDNQLHAFKASPRGLDREWAFRTGGDVIGRPIVAGESIYFCSYDTYLYALRARNGHLSWKARLGRRPQPENLLLGDLLLVAPLNAERLEIFRAPDGAQAGSLSLAAGVERLVTPPVGMGSSFLVGIARYGEETSRVMLWDPRDLISPPAASAR